MSDVLLVGVDGNSNSDIDNGIKGGNISDNENNSESDNDDDDDRDSERSSDSDIVTTVVL